MAPAYVLFLNKEKSTNGCVFLLSIIKNTIAPTTNKMAKPRITGCVQPNLAPCPMIILRDTNATKKDTKPDQSNCVGTDSTLLSGVPFNKNRLSKDTTIDPIKI